MTFVRLFVSPSSLHRRYHLVSILAPFVEHVMYILLLLLLLCQLQLLL